MAQPVLAVFGGLKGAFVLAGRGTNLGRSQAEWPGISGEAAGQAEVTDNEDGSGEDINISGGSQEFLGTSNKFSIGISLCEAQ